MALRVATFIPCFVFAPLPTQNAAMTSRSRPNLSAPPAIILGGGDCAIGIVRAFAQKRVPIVLLYYADTHYARHSRFVSHRERITNPETDPDRLLDFLRAKSKQWAGGLLVPADDRSVEFLSRYRDDLLRHYATPVMAWGTTEKILNKGLLYRVADEHEVPLPKVHFPRTTEEVDQVCTLVEFPCLLKPVYSHQFLTAFEKKLVVIDTPCELRHWFRAAGDKQIDVMVCELVPGDDASLYHYRCYKNAHGEVLAEICTRKLRQYPKGFGVASLSRTVPMMEDLKSLSLRLLEAFSYTGTASVEFKRDARDGCYKLMEINVRNVLPERLLFKAGVNFPWVAYRDLVDKAPVSQMSYHTNTRWVQNYLELSRLLYYRDLSWREFLGPYTDGSIRCIPFLDDPLPFVSRGLAYAR